MYIGVLLAFSRPSQVFLPTDSFQRDRITPGLVSALGNTPSVLGPANKGGCVPEPIFSSGLGVALLHFDKGIHDFLNNAMWIQYLEFGTNSIGFPMWLESRRCSESRNSKTTTQGL
jgi:hypothetical protein